MTWQVKMKDASCKRQRVQVEEFQIATAIIRMWNADLLTRGWEKLTSIASIASSKVLSASFLMYP